MRPTASSRSTTRGGDPTRPPDRSAADSPSRSASAERRARRSGLQVGVERAVPVQELLLGVDAIVDLRHQRGRQLFQLCRQRVHEALAGLRSSVRTTMARWDSPPIRFSNSASATAAGAPWARARGGRSAGRRRAGPRRGRRRRTPGSPTGHQERPAQGERCPPLPEPRGPGELLHSVFLTPRPVGAPTASIASRSSESPDSAVSRSMVSAG